MGQSDFPLEFDAQRTSASFTGVVTYQNSLPFLDFIHVIGPTPFPTLIPANGTEAAIPKIPFFGDYLKEKKMRRKFLATFTIVALSLGTASAETLTFTNSSSDDSYTAYISTSNSTLGTQIFSGGNGVQTPNTTTTLNPGQDYFIHIVAINDGGAGGWGGEFTLSGGTDLFLNGTTTELTKSTPSDWQASDGETIGTSWVNSPLSYTAVLESGVPSLYAATGMLWSPGPHAGTDPGAWNGQCTSCQVDFSTEIVAPPTVPEPSSFALLGTGMLAFAGVVRRKIGR